MDSAGDGADGAWDGSFALDFSDFSVFAFFALGGVTLGDSSGASTSSPAWIFSISDMVAFVFFVALGACWSGSCIRVVGVNFFNFLNIFNI